MAGRGPNGGYPPSGGENFGNQPIGRQGFRGQGFNGRRDDRGGNQGNGGYDRMGNRNGNSNQGGQVYPQQNFGTLGPSNNERGEGSGAAQQYRSFDRRGQGEFRGDFGAYNEGFYERGNRNFQGNMSNYNNQRYRNNQGSFGAAGQGRGSTQGRGRYMGRGGNFPPRSNGQADSRSNGSMDVEQEEVVPATVAVYKPKEVVSTDQQGDAQQGTKKVTSVQPGKAKNKQDKCFRCGFTGHIGTDCTTPLCVFCDSALHSEEACPLPKMPKPTATLYGMARECLMFFKINKSDNLRLKNDSGKVGRIRISGGKMSAPQVLKELEWLVPGDHVWEIYPVGDSDFRVIFPTKADFLRLKRIKFIEVEGTDISMYFEDWTSQLCDKWGLYDIWVRISGCPEPLCRDYLALFAVGSLIGETKEVDMRFTREHSVVRARIDCANPEGIPRSLDFLYEGEGYGIFIDIEAEDGSIVHAGDFYMNEPPADDNNGAKEKDDQQEKKVQEEKNHDGLDKNKKTDVTADKTEKMDTDDKPSEPIDHIQFGTISLSPNTCRKKECQSVQFEVFTPSPVKTTARSCVSAPRKLWGDRVDDDEESLPSPMAVSAPNWPRPKSPMLHISVVEAAAVEKPASPTATDLHVMTVGVQSTATATKQLSKEGFTAVTPPCSPGGSAPTSPRPAGHHSPRTPDGCADRNSVSPRHGTGVFLGGRYTQEEIIAYGGIPEAHAKEVRSSSRVRAQENADDTQMARAQKRAQERDDLELPGYPDGYSLDPYVVLPTINGEARRNGFWVQLPGIGRIGSIFPVQLAF